MLSNHGYYHLHAILILMHLVVPYEKKVVPFARFWMLFVHGDHLSLLFICWIYSILEDILNNLPRLWSSKLQGRQDSMVL